jgi:hypothetical protein
MRTFESRMSRYEIREFEGKRFFLDGNGTWREVQKLPTVKPKPRRRSKGWSGKFAVAGAMRNACG